MPKRRPQGRAAKAKINRPGRGGKPRKGACPTPGKVRYPDKATAERFNADGVLRAYACPSTDGGRHWHLTHRADWDNQAA